MNAAENAWDAAIRMSHAVAKKKIGGIFFTSMSVAHADDDEDRGGDAVHAGERLPNGDFYTGEWIEHLPHGYGKYLWRDGCMYVGEWFHGKTMGKGCFSWPSGATYEGEFKSGYMDGHGTYTGASGVTYRGSWAMNLRHGHGAKSYVNGDFYEGEWRHGVQEGHGRYQWNNGNHYVGEWMNGAMGGGNGTMTWESSGNSFEGWWEDGVPKGNGTFRWHNGSFYVGVWGKEVKDQSGTYYPSDGGSEWDPDLLLPLDMGECKVCHCEKVSVFPSQKVFYWETGDGESLMKQNAWWMLKGNGHRNKPKRSSVDGRTGAVMERPSCEGDVDASTTGREEEDDGCGFSQFGDFESRGGKLQQLRFRQMKRQGDTICKGHKNYELMLNLQLGIRHSVGRCAPATSLDLKASAFDPKDKVWTKFPPEGSKYTPPHQSCDFRWKDYCPLVFRTLRKLFQVDPADYMLSICGNDALRELCSPGKSGSFFYLTDDDRYMIKTVKKAESKVLLRMLPEYYKHVRAFTNTLVTRFFGLHCVKLGASQKKVRFVIMGNLFCSEYTIHRRYDLKGSSHGRITDRPGAEVDATTTLKDLDLNLLFRLHKAGFQDFCRQVDRDCDFLEQERIMDYSLLIGVHFRESCALGECHSSASSGTHTENGDPLISTPHSENMSSCVGNGKLGVNMAARAERTVRRGENEGQLVGDPTGEFYEIVLFFGIIDILQDYDISKKLEHAYKSIQYDPSSISAVDPKQYARRFRDFIFKVFAEDASQ